jgi:hypothetical protein
MKDLVELFSMNEGYAISRGMWLLGGSGDMDSYTVRDCIDGEISVIIGSKVK